MKEMNLAFYGEEFMDENPEAARTYCGRYQDGKIAHKEKSEALYIHYLTTLEDQGDPIASLSLGDFYFYGSEFTEKDYSKALIHYSHRSLFANPKALCGLGLCYLDRMEDEKGFRESLHRFLQSRGPWFDGSRLSFGRLL